MKPSRYLKWELSVDSWLSTVRLPVTLKSVLSVTVLLSMMVNSQANNYKDDVKEVTNGREGGLMIDGYNDIKMDDVIEPTSWKKSNVIEKRLDSLTRRQQRLDELSSI